MFCLDRVPQPVLVVLCELGPRKQLLGSFRNLTIDYLEPRLFQGRVKLSCCLDPMMAIFQNVISTKTIILYLKPLEQCKIAIYFTLHKMKYLFTYKNLTGSLVIGSVADNLKRTDDGGSSSLTTNSIFGSLGVHGAEN